MIDLFNNQATNPSDNEPIIYFENFISGDKQEREFYFRVVTNSHKVADGAYAEGLGYEGKRFIENYPKNFASFFDNTNCFTENDLSTWAEILVSEFAIDNEGEYDKPIVNEYINKVKLKCQDCSQTDNKIINRFGMTLNKKWREYLKKND